jgi:deoxyribose-phosphate aldolase
MSAWVKATTGGYEVYVNVETATGMQRVGDKTKIYSAAGTVLAVDQTPAELLAAAEIEVGIAGSVQKIRIAETEKDPSIEG